MCLHNCSKWAGLLRHTVVTTTNQDILVVGGGGGGEREISPWAGFDSALHQSS